MKVKTILLQGSHKYTDCEIEAAPEPLTGDFVKVKTRDGEAFIVNKERITEVYPEPEPEPEFIVITV